MWNFATLLLFPVRSHLPSSSPSFSQRQQRDCDYYAHMNVRHTKSNNNKISKSTSHPLVGAGNKEVNAFTLSTFEHLQ